MICRGKEGWWRRKSRERMREEGRHQSLMPILQPVQRGLVFRRARRSAGAFCHPFKPAVAMINKHDISPPLTAVTLCPVPDSIDRSICNARSVAKKCQPDLFGVPGKGETIVEDVLASRRSFLKIASALYQEIESLIVAHSQSARFIDLPYERSVKATGDI